MTASERYLAAVFGCHHQADGACVDCLIAAFIAHADAVKREAVRVARQWCRQWEAGAETASYIAAAIECIEVT